VPLACNVFRNAIANRARTAARERTMCNERKVDGAACKASDHQVVLCERERESNSVAAIPFRFELLVASVVGPLAGFGSQNAMILRKRSSCSESKSTRTLTGADHPKGDALHLM